MDNKVFTHKEYDCVDLNDYVPKADLRKLAERLTKEANSESNDSEFFQGYRSGIREAVIAINEVRGK